jgi:hypothetical protein
MVKKCFSRTTVTLLRSIHSMGIERSRDARDSLNGHVSPFEGGLRGMTLRLVYHNQLFSIQPQQAVSH